MGMNPWSSLGLCTGWIALPLDQAKMLADPGLRGGSSVSSTWRAAREGAPDLMRARERAVRFEDEYAAFYRAEFPHVVRTSYLIVHDRQRAEEIAQEAFIQLLTHWRKVSRYEQPSAWVRRVAIRVATRSARREGRRRALEQGADVTRASAGLDLDLLNAIKKLPAQQRAAVALFYFEDRPLPEVADILGCSHAAAKVHVFNARRRLADLLRQEVSDVERR
jgi:RNA polymerase sigma-70 factor (ECF subfamily)